MLLVRYVILLKLFRLIVLYFFTIPFQSFVFCNTSQSKNYMYVLCAFCKKAKVDSLQTLHCFIKVKKGGQNYIEIFQTKNLFIRFMTQRIKSTILLFLFYSFHFKSETFGKRNKFVKKHNFWCNYLTSGPSNS